jgi:hypothetical protein
MSGGRTASPEVEGNILINLPIPYNLYISYFTVNGSPQYYEKPLSPWNWLKVSIQISHLAHFFSASAARL